MKKRNSKAIILVLLLAVFGIVLTYNLGNITAKLVGKIYPEYIIQNEEFGSDKVVLKDFLLGDNGDIISETNDPWLYIGFAENDVPHLLCMEINITNATNEGEWVEIYYVDRYKLETICLKQGANSFKLPQLEKKDVGLRIDLTGMAKQTIHVERIVWNNNQYLTKYFCEKIGHCTVFLIMMALTLGACSSEKFLNVVGRTTKAKKRDAVFMAMLLGILFAVIGVWMLSAIFFLMALLLSETYVEKQSCLLWIAYGIVGIGFAYQMSFENMWMLYTLSDKLLFLLCFLMISLAAMGRWDVLGSTIFFIGVYAYVQYALNDYTINYFCKYILVNARLALNIMLYIVVLMAFKSILGRNFGAFLFHIIFGVYVIANFIKIKFQNALFSKADLKLLREVVGIAEQYINKQYLIIGLLVGILLLVGCIIWHKKIGAYLKPQYSLSGV